MLISDIMNKNVVKISPEEPVSLAARLMNKNNVGALPVASESGKLLGMVTDRDVVTRCVAFSTDPEETPVKEIMSRAVTSVSPSDTVDKASSLMAKMQVRRLPVTENGRVVGIVSLGDLAKRRDLTMEAAAALSEISSNVKRK